MVERLEATDETGTTITFFPSSEIFETTNFNYETLATRVQEKASLEKLGEAAPPAVIVMAVGLVAVALLARASRMRERV